MTREEAINYLHECSEAIGDTEHHTLSYAKEALNMAIKALSQQTEDAISRQAVEEVINDIRDCISVEGYCAILERLNKLPSVNPQEPKTGEWQQDFDGTYLCSECGSGFKEQPTFMGKPMFLWCPLCGAKMGEQA